MVSGRIGQAATVYPLPRGDSPRRDARPHAGLPTMSQSLSARGMASGIWRPRLNLDVDPGHGPAHGLLVGTATDLMLLVLFVITYTRCGHQ